jgi:hypothetical protein
MLPSRQFSRTAVAPITYVNAGALRFAAMAKPVRVPEEYNRVKNVNDVKQRLTGRPRTQRDSSGKKDRSE